MGRRYDVSQPIHRAYDPVCEEDECHMVTDAGPDTTGPAPDRARSATPDPSGPATGRKPGRTPPPGRASPPPDAADPNQAEPPDNPDLPDPRQLAQDWITLWQSELSAIAADREIRESWQTITALWATTLSGMLAGAGAPYDGASRHARPADAPRAAPAAAAPDARDAEIDRLTRHVAALERKLDDLTGRIERVWPDGPGDPPGPAKRAPQPRPGRKPRR
jgi:hypothetical protein